MARPNSAPAESYFEAKEIELLDRLGAAGYTFGGGADVETGTTHIGIGLDTEVARVTLEEALAALPITDDNGEILEGYEVGSNEDTGQFELGYDGPLDERFEQVVSALVQLAQPGERERLSKVLAAECLGEKCVNWSGTACSGAYQDLLEADGDSGGEDLPPFKDEPTFALYGHVCTGGEKPALVATHAIRYAPVSIIRLVELSGRYGDIPFTVSAEDHSPSSLSASANARDLPGNTTLGTPISSADIPDSGYYDASNE